MTVCSGCGAHIDGNESCADRFAVLLALDHSRQEPWGSRHGIAFAVYTLQHTSGIADSVLENCWFMLSRVYQSGDDRLDVVKGIRATYRGKHDNSYSKSNRPQDARWDGASLPTRIAPPNQFDVTIANLGEFSADTYPELLDAWCLATLRAWTIPE